MKNKIKLPVLAATLVLTAASCVKKEFDSPPVQEIPVGHLLTLQDLRDTFAAGGNVPIRFDKDYSIYANVTMDDQNGNIYKNAYVQDPTGAIVLRTLFSGGLYEGDSVRIALKGTTLSSYNGMLQLDSVDVDKNIIKQATGKHIAPEDVTLADIVNGDYQAKLVRINNVEFSGSELNNTYANAITQQTQNRTLIDCDETHSALVRTSGYADFADEMVAQGNGSIVCVVGVFNNDKQLYIRKPSEINMNGNRCTANPFDSYLFKNFSDESITSGGWINYVVTSTPQAGINWYISDQGSSGNHYAVASGYQNGSTSTTEIWLISPAVDLSQASAPGMSFKSSKNYTGPALQLMISTDYDGTSDPSTNGTWVNYTGYATWSPGTFSWTNSGIIPLTQFLGNSSVYFAFKYTSSAPNSASTWQVDDIIINEN